MRLLFDQNLPNRFIVTLGDLFPASSYVKLSGLSTASDKEIWDFARSEGFAIISKDADFHQMSFLYGAPPKTVWLRCGNCTVAELEAIIRGRSGEILRFGADSTGALLVIGRDHI